MPLLVVLRGLPGIGKTSLAGSLARELGWPLLDKDDFKQVLLGRVDAADELAYDLLFEVAGWQLAHGLSVLCDSPLQFASLYELAQRTAQTAAAQLVVLDCVLSDAAEHRRRIEARQRQRPRGWGIQQWSDLKDYRARLAGQADFFLDVPHRVVDLSQTLAAAVADAATWLRTLA